MLHPMLLRSCIAQEGQTAYIFRIKRARETAGVMLPTQVTQRLAGDDLRRRRYGGCRGKWSEGPKCGQSGEQLFELAI